MPKILRLEMPQSGDARRWLIGLLVSPRYTDVTAALLAVEHGGLDARATIVAGRATRIEPDLAAALRALEAATSPAGAMALCGTRLAEMAAVAVHELLGSVGVAPERILAIGLHEPGLWQFDHGSPAGWLSVCDGSRLAERTGASVIDAFAARDLAQGGQGGPLTPLAQWLLLRERQHDRVLLDLGRTTRMTLLPAARGPNATARIMSFDVGPGTNLLDLLAEKLTCGESRFDVGGRLAVQGRKVLELVDHWLADPYFSRPLPKWHPRGVRPERFLAEAVQMAVERGWSVRDLLCSATHLIARSVAESIERRLSDAGQQCEIVVAGGGQHNGLLLRELARHLDRPVVRLSELVQLAEAFEAATIGLLAMFYVDQVPANLPAVTGAELPRLLGRLMPGSPPNWQRLLQSATAAISAPRPLRAAL